MHRVTMSFIDMQGMITVTFIENGKKVGRQYRYTDDRRLFDILRTCACPIEDHNLVERCLVDPPITIAIDLVFTFSRGDRLNSAIQSMRAKLPLDKWNDL